MESHVKLTVYNVLGRTVKILIDGIESAGYKNMTWYASDFTSGIYFYRLDAVSLTDPGKSFTRVKKAILIK